MIRIKCNVQDLIITRSIPIRNIIEMLTVRHKDKIFDTIVVNGVSKDVHDIIRITLKVKENNSYDIDQTNYSQEELQKLAEEIYFKLSTHRR